MAKSMATEIFGKSGGGGKRLCAREQLFERRLRGGVRRLGDLNLRNRVQPEFLRHGLARENRVGNHGDGENERLVGAAHLDLMGTEF